MERRAAPLLILALGTIGFSLAMAARSVANPWWTNAGVAIFVLLSSGLFLKDRLIELFDFRIRTIALSVLLGGAMVAATHLGYAIAIKILPGLGETVAGLYHDVGSNEPSQAITLGLIFVVVAAEEVLWRGLAVDLLGRRFGRVVTGLAAVLLYTLPQLVGGTWVLVAAAIAAGGVFTAQRLLSGELAGPLVTHTIWSLCIFSLIPLG